MPFIPWMWCTWGALVLVFIAFRIYVSRINRNEDDQLILQDSFNQLRDEQAAIVAKLEKTKPVGYVILGLLGAMTLYMIGFYVLDMIRQFS